MTPDPGARDPHVGLCSHCAQARVVRSAKGSTFWLCQRAATDPRFSKYPRLPVAVCSGFSEGQPSV